MKGNRWMLSFGLLILMSASVFGCGQEEGTGTTDEIEGTYLCYVNTEEDSLARESYEIQGETADEEVEDVLEEMQKEADSIDYRSAFPDHVSVTDWSLTDGRLDLTFSDSYLRMSKGEEVLLRAALVETLGQIKGVDEVGFFTGEGPLTDSDGQEIGHMSRQDVLHQTGAEALFCRRKRRLPGAGDGQPAVQQQYFYRKTGSGAADQRTGKRGDAGGDPAGDPGAGSVRPGAYLLCEF